MGRKIQWGLRRTHQSINQTVTKKMRERERDPRTIPGTGTTRARIPLRWLLPFRSPGGSAYNTHGNTTHHHHQHNSSTLTQHLPLAPRPRTLHHTLWPSTVPSKILARYSLHNYFRATSPRRYDAPADTRRVVASDMCHARWEYRFFFCPLSHAASVISDECWDTRYSDLSHAASVISNKGWKIRVSLLSLMLLLSITYVERQALFCFVSVYWLWCTLRQRVLLFVYLRLLHATLDAAWDTLPCSMDLWLSVNVGSELFDNIATATIFLNILRPTAAIHTT